MRSASYIPASTATATFATDPRIMAVHKPAPIFSYAANWTSAALSIASAAPTNAGNPRVSTKPTAKLLRRL